MLNSSSAGEGLAQSTKPLFLFQDSRSLPVPIMAAEKRAIRQVCMQSGGDIVSCTIQGLGNSSASFDASMVPVGSVEFCLALMDRLDIPVPPPFSYPEILDDMLGRRIYRAQYRDVPNGAFLKPAGQVKLFDGHIKGSYLCGDSELSPSKLDSVEVWWCHTLEFLAEFRVYVLNGRVVGWAQYGEGEDRTPDLDIVAEAAARLSSLPCPVGYTLDFGLLQDGRHVLVEMNDGWAIGLYKDDRGGISPNTYASLIMARWHQIVAGTMIGVGQIS